MISVIIVNHNYKKYIDKCFNSVLKNNSNLIKEIIIIDDRVYKIIKIIFLKSIEKLRKLNFIMWNLKFKQNIKFCN